MDKMKNWFLIICSGLSERTIHATIPRYMRTPKQTIALLLLPLLVAAGNGRILVEDSIAGLGLDVLLENFASTSPLTVSIETPDTAPIRQVVTTDAKGSASLAIPGNQVQRSGTYRVQVEQQRAIVAGPVAAEVSPERMDSRTSSLQTWTPSIRADGRQTADVSATLRDRFGNALPSRPVTLVSNRFADRIDSLTPETDAEGTQHFRVATDEAGTIHLRAIDLISGETLADTISIEAAADRGIGGPSNTASNGRKMFYAQVSSFDVIDRFEITAPADIPLGQEAQKVSIRAIDRNDNTVEDYIGTVRFSSTDPDATLPNFGTYTFKDRDLGEKSFPLVLTFRTPGEHMFRVEDANDASIFGEATIVVGGGGPVTPQIMVTSHRDGDFINTTDIVVTGQGPRFANLIVMGGTQDATGATDENGAFSIPISLSSAQRDFTIRVRDDAGRKDSGPIHLILDQTAPEIGTISFVPENPEEGQNVLIAVESEPGLAQLLLRIPKNRASAPADIRLAENPTASGAYQAFFPAPSAGSYQPSLIAMDRAGNVTEVRSAFTVGSKALPSVENLQAEPRANAVALSWDPVETDVDQYRVYVGSGEDDFLYSLDTGNTTTKATVAGLDAGTPYTFAVTAVRGELESSEKSVPVTTQTLGLALTITPEQDALRIQWSAPATDLPLSSFLLEYGTQEDALTEKRMLSGNLEEFTLRDLLSGVPYFLRLTPITVTGETLEELSATGNGVPGATAGFQPSTRDDVPLDLTRHPGDTLHAAPTNAESGFSHLGWAFAAAVAACGVWMRWRHRRTLLQTAAFLRAVESQYHR